MTSVTEKSVHYRRKACKQGGYVVQVPTVEDQEPFTEFGGWAPPVFPEAGFPRTGAEVELDQFFPHWGPIPYTLTEKGELAARAAAFDAAMGKANAYDKGLVVGVVLVVAFAVGGGLGWVLGSGWLPF